MIIQNLQVAKTPFCLENSRLKLGNENGNKSLLTCQTKHKKFASFI